MNLLMVSMWAGSCHSFSLWYPSTERILRAKPSLSLTQVSVWSCSFLWPSDSPLWLAVKRWRQRNQSHKKTSSLSCLWDPGPHRLGWLGDPTREGRANHCRGIRNICSL